MTKDFNNDLALQEGWLVLWSDKHGLQIQRDDEAKKFADDDEALEHVKRCAAAGSLYHQKALEIVGKAA
jgi:hypothetical protein